MEIGLLGEMEALPVHCHCPESLLQTGVLAINFRTQAGTWFMKDANSKLMKHITQSKKKKKYSKLLCDFNLSLELRNVSLLHAAKSGSEM